MQADRIPTDEASRLRSLIDELWRRFPGVEDHELGRWDHDRRVLVSRLKQCEAVAS